MIILYLFLIFLLNGLILKQLFETTSDWQADGVGSTAAITILKQQSILALVDINTSFPVAV